MVSAFPGQAMRRVMLLKKLAELILVACVVGAYYGFWLGGHPWARWFALIATAPAAAAAWHGRRRYRQELRRQELARQRIVAWQRQMTAAMHAALDAPRTGLDGHPAPASKARRRPVRVEDDQHRASGGC